MLITVTTQPGQTGMDIKFVAQTIMLQHTTTLGTMQGQVTSQVIKLTLFTFRLPTAVVLTLMKTAEPLQPLTCSPSPGALRQPITETMVSADWPHRQMQ
jgi:hypothetical protein